MTGHTVLPPWAGWVGPRRPKVALVGEAWGNSEAQTRQAFVGASGRELWAMLGEAALANNWTAHTELHAQATEWHQYNNAWVKHREPWLADTGIAMTNVFALQPEGNKIDSICETKKQNPKAQPQWQLDRGKYLKEEYWPELGRLTHELTMAAPNLIVAMGNTACWALLHATNIASIRGTVAAPQAPGIATKVLPTFHPSRVLQQWSSRPIVVADLIKALRECEFPEIRRPRRLVLVNPGIGQIISWVEHCERQLPEALAVDIETGNRLIKCIGFARSKNDALVIPFEHPVTGSYWPALSVECEAWRLVQRLLALPCPKVFQNGVYDLQYLLRMGLRPRNCSEDTMLLHHALYPELQKGLGFLGSIYTDEASWKLMRKQRVSDAMTKADE